MAERGHLLPFPQAPDGVELRHLRAFVAVAEELNFSRAADRLYVSQPALSRAERAEVRSGTVSLLRKRRERRERYSALTRAAGIGSTRPSRGLN